MPTRKYADTFLFSLENVVIVPRPTVFWIKKKLFFLMSFSARNYPPVIVYIISLKLDGVGPVDKNTLHQLAPPLFSGKKLTCDTRHLTCDTWWGVNIVSEFQLPSSNSLGFMMF